MDPLSIATPALCVDASRLDANLARVADYARRHGLVWRPHVKTHKSPWVAARQVAAGAVGVSCATVREAEVMRAVTDDLLLAYPPVGPDRLRRTAALATTSRLGVMLDGVEAAEALSAAVRAAGTTARVLVEVDAGMRRTGAADVSAAIELAVRAAELPALTFDGFGFYPGHLRTMGPEIDGAIADLARLVAELREAAQRAGLAVATISCGSTPLLWRSHEIVGATELRAGTAAYFDRTSVLGGVCTFEECAVTVVATVVSTAVPGQVVLDAGVKAIGREPMRGADAPGYACVVGRPDLVVTRLSEEHGVVALEGTDWSPRVGDQVRLVPNHACVAVHNFDAMHVIDPDGRVEVLPVAARGR